MIESVVCSFCDKGTLDRRLLIAGPGGKAICDVCVRNAKKVSDDHDREPEPPIPPPTPARGRVIEFAPAAAEAIARRARVA